MRRWLALVLVAAAACSGGSAEDPDNPLSGMLVRTAAEGYRTVTGPASGPMTIEDAASDSAADITTKRTFLRRNGFQDGYSRVWTKGDDYITVLVHDFASDRGAKAMIDFEIEQVTRKAGTTTFSVEDIPGATGYILSGVKRKGLQPVFCQGVWFPSGTRAVAVNTCGPQPNSSDLARRIALEQAKLVAKT